MACELWPAPPHFHGIGLVAPHVGSYIVYSYGLYSYGLYIVVAYIVMAYYLASGPTRRVATLLAPASAVLEAYAQTGVQTCL